MTGGAGLPGAVTVSESYKQSPISGPSVVLHCTELLDPPHVNGGAMLNSVKSGGERITFKHSSLTSYWDSHQTDFLRTE